MDPALQVTDEPRRLHSNLSAEMPLVTLAWRALRAEHQRHGEQRERAVIEANWLKEPLRSIAVETHRLRRTAAHLAQDAQESSVGVQQMLAAADRIRDALEKIELEVLAPEGAPFRDPLPELFENVAQQVDAEASEPRVAEVIEPAVIYRGDLLQMGKAVIAVPGVPAVEEDGLQ